MACDFDLGEEPLAKNETGRKMTSPFLDILRQKIIVFDGAMGTSIQQMGLTAEDFHGKEGCNEYLVLSRPDAIESIHARFLEVGCDVIETDTFGGTAIVLGEYGLDDRIHELNRTAARLARKVADDFSTDDHPRFVAGSMGPGTRLPTLGHATYPELLDRYFEQASGLFEGGVDLFIIETVQDLLQAKAALNAVFKVMRQGNQRLPVMISVTMETSGTMLLGTDMLGALTTLEPYEVDVIGLNCATGPRGMSEHLHTLAAHSPFPISVIPNAGLPRNVNGEMVYDLTPESMAADLAHYVEDLGVNIVGGCCGTTPDHLAAVVAATASLSPTPRTPTFEPSASSLYGVAAFRQEPKPLIIGERTNTNGSKRFRKHLLEDDLDGMVGMAREQAGEGAHILDVCLAYVGRDEAADMQAFVSRLNSQLSIPLMIDSTEIEAIRAALELTTGRAIVNSINLEDGPDKAREIVFLCREFGAGLVALTIDEDGMARDADRKLDIAERLYELAVGEGGLRESDLFFDPLTFTLAAGDEDFRGSARETLVGIKLIKERFPEAQISLGISNVSFGLKPALRHILNSVFLQQAIDAGLDAAILHAGRIIPYHAISEEDRELFEDLIYDRRRQDYDPLAVILERTTDPATASGMQKVERLVEIEARLAQHIIDGDRNGLEADLDEALSRFPALDIINHHLLKGMKTVGELFGDGKLQLPFVLQSAETMKAAVSYLEPHMEKSSATSKGKLLLATVKGDVHDIGKNLVDIILTNNGYEVFNLGIKVPIEAIIQQFETSGADAIGMSGLLVKSTVIMKENLEVLNDRGLTPPVILGGAALTLKYVEHDLQALYKGPVRYARDAFAGLAFMDALADIEPGRESQTPSIAKAENESKETTFEALAPVEHIPTPPFWGRRVSTENSLQDLIPWINTAALFRGQWGFKQGKMDSATYARLERETILPEFERQKERAGQEKLLNPLVVYGYFQCQSEGERLWIYDRPEAVEPSHFLDFPRQQRSPGRCISDFFLSRASGKRDVVALQVVTVGSRATKHANALYQENRYQDYLYFHGFAVETAEALAELWHARIRRELGIHRDDAREIKDLFKQAYQGSRYSFGYPACPDLAAQETLFDLLDARREGLSLTESFQIIPEQSTSALIVHHPEAKYFSV